MEEETEYQRYQYRSRVSRYISIATPASPRFIAQFRLAGWKLVGKDLIETSCSICLEGFRLNQGFAQWPCPAKHTFHYQCMLDALRTGNKCPLCRHPVEEAKHLHTEAILSDLYYYILRSAVGR